jgi:hypothetical protein
LRSPAEILAANGALVMGVRAIVMKARIVRTEVNPTVTQAKKGDNWSLWSQTIDEELELLRSLGTGVQVRKRDVPPGVQIIPSKMDLKTKVLSSGMFRKRKARLVALGDQEWEKFEEDYYSPTVDHATINLMFALAASYGYHIHGLDIYGAFITSNLDDPNVYIQLPPGIVEKDCDGNDPIWRLLKSLYGLRCAPKIFYLSIALYLIEHCGMTQSKMDPCLFYRREGADRKIFCSIHVDDFAIVATHQELITELCEQMKKRYTITETTDLETFLGVRIIKRDTGLYLSQPGHILKIAKEAGITDDYPRVRTPMSSTFNTKDQKDSPPCDEHKYRKLLGMVIFALRTRPECGTAVSLLSERTKGATQKDYEELRHTSAYLVQTIEMELVYSSLSTEQSQSMARLHAWADAAYLVHADSKSQFGICFAYGNKQGMFHSRSGKQDVVATSSTQAELTASFEAAKEIIYFRDVLEELGLPEIVPTPLYTDNKSLLTLATNFSGNRKKVKHFLMRLNFLIEQVKKQVIQLVYIPTDDLCADALTKPLAAGPFEKHREQILGPQRDSNTS